MTTIATEDREKMLVEKFKAAKEQSDFLKNAADEAKERLLQAERELMELLDDQGKKSSAKFEGLGHVTCVEPRINASILEGAEDHVFDYLRENNRADMIKLTVHSSTLSTFVKELLSENKPLPEGITYYEKRWLRFYPIKHKE